MHRVFIAASFCLIAWAAFAQSDRGTITGTITDPAGAVVPAVTIEAKNTSTGSIYQAATTGTGNYTLAQLPVGSYQLSVSVPGFKKYTRTGITVMVAQILRIDIVLEVGSINETVTVDADAALLRTESGELSHNVSSERMGDLPMLGFEANIRNPYAVTQLIPGAAYADRNYVRVNGAPANTQALRIDGQDATFGLLQSQTTMAQPSMDAIEEFAVQTSNYAAEYGQAGGGFFNVTMKSGTNRFHGSAYDYWANEALNASQPYVNTKSRQRRNNYGFTLGGPVWIPKVYDGHDKTFFFFNFEQYRETRIYASNPQTVPTLAYRAGDFRQALTGRVLGKDPLGRDIIEGTIYDPATERIVNDQRVRDPFPDNTIPTDRYDSVAAKIQALIPEPTNSNLINNYLVPWESPNIRTIPAVKVDQNVGNRSKLSFYWSSTRIDAPYSVGSYGGDGLPSPVTEAKTTYIDSYTSRVNYDFTMSPTTILHLGGGVQYAEIVDDVDADDYDQAAELGLYGSQTSMFPRMTSLSAGRGGMKNMGAMPGIVKSTMLKPTGNANFTWVKSNHTYKFGAEMRVEGYPIQIRTTAMGNYVYSAEQTTLPSTQGQDLKGGTIGFPYASFLLGRVSSGDIGYPVNIRMGKTAWALYAQDSWKISRKLTLDYGLRWDYQGYLQEQYGRFSNFSPETPNPSAGNLPGAVIFEGEGPGLCNCDFAEVYPYSFGPRLGLAYQIKPQTVLRIGWGIMYGQTSPENAVSSSGVGSNNPFTSTSYGDPAMVLSEGLPTPAPWPSLDPGLYPRTGTISTPSVNFDHNAGRPGRMFQWSISVQHEITRDLVVELAYVGNRGAWWEANALIDVNALTAERTAEFGLDIDNADDRKLLTSQLNSQLAADRGFNTLPYPTYPATVTVAQSLRPYPQFGKINYFWAPLGKTWYDAFQIKATKRFSHGLDFTTTFSWQKELTMGAEQSTGGMAAAVNDVFDRKTNKYISGFSRPFVFVTALNYTVPRMNIYKPLSWALRDWTIGTVLQYASGMPIKAPIAQNQLSSLLFRSTFAERVEGESLFTKNLNSDYDPSYDFVLNPKAWVDPPAGHFSYGAAYYSDYRYQRRPSEAVSLGRIFRLKEGVNLSIRADFQNIFNRPFPANPTSTNAKATQTVSPTTGKTISGFGFINTGTVAVPPRSGLIVARISF